jgi:hypothetical protein
VQRGVERASQTRLNILACPETERFERSGQRALLALRRACGVQVKPVCFSSVWKMSFEEIISEVQGKPEIWLSRHPLYKSWGTAKKTWNETAVKLGIKGIYIFILLGKIC